MFVKSIGLLLGATLLVLSTGCQRSSNAETSPPAKQPPLGEHTVLRLHWLGKRQLGVEGSAFYFCRIWDLPQSKALEAQTLDKLAAAPWRLLLGEASLSNAPVAALRPLLDNVRHEETYLEIRSATNHPVAMALAVRLREEAAMGWQHNLSIIAQSLTGIQPKQGRGENSGWTVIHPRAPERFEFSRAGEWVVFGFSQGENRLMDELIARLKAHPDPFATRQTNLWLRADVDLQWLSSATGLGTNFPGELPRVSAVVSGDGAHVITRATLAFKTPMTNGLTPWTPPSDLLHEPLSSFTAIRGIHPILSRMNAWNVLPLGTAPDQCFIWTRTNSPFHGYLAAPLPDATGKVNALTDHLLAHANAWLTNRGYVAFERLPGAPGVRWGDLQEIQPFITEVDGDPGFLLAGLFPDQGAKDASVSTRVKDLLSDPADLVACGWEDTSARIEPWLPLSQTAQLLARRAQLPFTSTSLVWLGALKPRLGETTTLVTRAGPLTLGIERRSTVGLTAAELHLLADWLESPAFPRGLHSTTVKPQMPPDAGQ